jgi:predicted acylesterase/phospholipase RssA
MDGLMPVLAAFAVLSGCQTQNRLVPPLDPIRPAAYIPLEESAATARSQAPESSLGQSTASGPKTGPFLEPPTAPARRPNKVLVLSGGGSYGAFTAGFLSGWTKSGTRPEFDVITGVSTGALIAPMAFIGPKHDDDIRRLYTGVKQKDVITMRSWATVPFRDAAASAAPLRRTVEAELSPESVAEIAAEHRRGRRLYIGTTNLDARRFVIWDIGAIAARGGPDARRLIVDILIASASVPGVFPPVEIQVEVDGKPYTELHVDGGVTSPLFIPVETLESMAKPGPAPEVYVIVAGKQYADPAAVKTRVLRVLGASAGVFYHGLQRAEVSRIYHSASRAGASVRVASLRQDFPITDTGIEFDQDSMNRLYAEGHAVGAGGPAWDPGPPERAPGDGTPIRTGNRFKSKP